jgi:TolB-like protein/Tfp pilus assembly protein PilF
MTSERWQQVNDLFQLAAERAPAERKTFLQTACQGDEGLRREVESLIASYERAENFIESPAFEVVPELLTKDQTSAIVGESIAHYRIESLIGVGGMGEVYLARDERLGRKAALKFLPERLTANNVQLSRFKSEARAASALNHPNILTVYEIGTEGNRHFIATEFIEGVTLRAALARGRMRVYDALEVGVQVASALDAAHKTGVVHRDIKPENIMIRPDGYVKVLDFGLAKLTEQKSVPDNRDLAITNTQHTYAGLLIGTPRYMSPEQARGQPADARSDIWSLGAVLYEMVSGVPPFSGATPSDCIASILETEAPPLSRLAPTAPTELQSVLHKALHKNKDDRYQTIPEMLADLRSLKGKLERAASAPKIQPALLWTAAAAAIVLVGVATLFFTRYRSLPVAAPASGSSSTLGTESSPPANIPEKSIAVLPFENRSHDADNAYFADAIQDEILTRLSKIADLKVISRTSTQHYKTVPANVPDIAKQLGVAHILEGSVQKTGDAVRVNVQLIKAANDSHLWADTLDRKLRNTFSVESEVAKAIADQLGAKLTGHEEQVIAAKPTENPQAYDAYLRGLAYSLKPANTTANILGAQRYLREAVRLDPKFALAWALLSSVDSLAYLTKIVEPTIALREEARQSAETALSLQPNLGEALLAKGYYYYACLKDYDTAIGYFEQARPLLPNDSRVAESLAYVTRRRGQWKQSESYFNEAERLDVRNANLLTQHALSYMRLRQFPEALRKLDQVLNITPDDVRTVAFEASIAQAEGDLPRAASLLAPLHPNADDPGTLETQVYQAILERRPASIIPRLQEILAKPDPELGYFNGDVRVWLGWAQHIVGDDAAARNSLQQARTELESFLKDQPENSNVLGDLALANMGLGDKSAALDLAERAIAANPIEKDATSGPSGIETFARVAAQIGMPDRAIAALQKLLSIPAITDTAAPFTPALLRLDPMFDPLRNDSRFQELVAPAGTPPSAPTQVPDKSIAVLPFENRSSDPENAFFTDGVQDEILTDLARIADLKVISRTSVMQYKTETKRNLRQIGKELGVAHVLEGSVQRAGNRVRVNAQLIDARSDTHLWAQTYDRDLSDVFAIQTEIAKTIADQLQAKLSPSEKNAIEEPPTTDVAAFDFYSHAKNLFLTAFSGTNGQADLLRAADLLKQAVMRDPSFFQAYCQLAFTEINIYGVLDHNPAYLAQAEAALESAARLRPDAGETHLARARNLYWGYLDYDGALRELEIARQSLPGEDWIFSLKGYIERRHGRWEECIRDLRRATELDPRNVLTLQQLAITYLQLRRYVEQKSTYERILAFEPNDPITKSAHAFVELDSKADTRPLHELIDSIRDRNPAALPGVADNWLLCAFAERDPAVATKALIALGENPASLGPIVDVRFNRPFMEGIIATLAKDGAKAQTAFTAARVEQEKTVQTQPGYGPALCVLGLIDAGLGRKEEALREGRRAIELLPMRKDATNGAAMIKYLAIIAAWVGETDLACEQLDIAIRRPGSLSYGQLKLMPFWDPLRGDSRFERIVEESKQSVALKQN